MKTITEPMKLEKMKILELTADHLTVEWYQDKHRSTYSIVGLRKGCPCATCRTEKDKMAANPLAVLSAPPSQQYTIDDLAPVGRYAVNFLFSDGHSSGLYAFDYLRGLCPCGACQQATK